MSRTKPPKVLKAYIKYINSISGILSELNKDYKDVPLPNDLTKVEGFSFYDAVRFYGSCLVDVHIEITDESIKVWFYMQGKRITRTYPPVKGFCLEVACQLSTLRTEIDAFMEQPYKFKLHHGTYKVGYKENTI